MAEGQSTEATQESVMDVTGQQIARRYAEGFIGAAGEGAEKAVEDLSAINDEMLEQHPRLLEALCSAFLDHDQRVGMIDRVFGGRVDHTVLKLLKVISAHDRMELLPSVAVQARELLNKSLNRHDVTVRVATPIDDALRDRIAQAVREKLAIEPLLEIQVVPELIGGMEIRVGDTVFDGSLRTAFAKAHKSIVEQTVQAIETQPDRFTLAS